MSFGGLFGDADNSLDGLLNKNLLNEIKLSKTLQNWLNNQPTPSIWREIIEIIKGPLQNNS